MTANQSSATAYSPRYTDDTDPAFWVLHFIGQHPKGIKKALMPQNEQELAERLVVEGELRKELALSNQDCRFFIA